MKRLQKIIMAVTVSLIAPVVLSSPAFEPKDEGWKFSVGMYLITQNIEADSTANTPDGGTSTTPVDLSFEDVLDNQVGLGSLFLRYGDGTWGVELDYSFIKLENKPNENVGPVTLNKVNFDVEELELVGTYRLHEHDLPIDLLFGIRSIDHDLKIDQTVNTPTPLGVSANFGDQWIDPFLGARVSDNISDTNWFYTTRFDLGGFGIGSDLIWRFDLGAGYAWDNGWQAVVKYKRLDIDYDNDSTSDLYVYDGYEHGIVIGGAYTF